MRMIDFGNMPTTAPTTYDDRPVSGAYVIVITKVTDHPAESYLEIVYDIAEGPYKGYCSRLRAEHPDWTWVGTYRRYYTPAALWAFRKLGDAVSRSNGNYVFDGARINCDEKTLVGKKMGLVLRDREYYGNDGNLRTRLEVLKEVPVDRVPYEPIPSVYTIAQQEERKARRQGTPAPAPAAYAQPAQPAQAFAQAPAYQQPVQTVARQTAAPTYAQPQAQPAQAQAYAANPALAQFVDVSGDTEMMPFM